MLRVFLQVFRGGNLLILFFIVCLTCSFVQFKLGVTSLYLPLWIAISTMTIAAPGYLINNYFDLEIDSYNKPNQVLCIKKWSKFKVYCWYITLNCIGLLSTLKLFLITREFNIIYFNLSIIILLFFYSFYFKKTCLVGNIFIALFAAYTYFFIYYIYKNQFIRLNNHDWVLIHYIFIFYILFAFLVSFIRELVKDIQDVTGDSLGGCKTLPIVIGISKTMIFLKIVLWSTLLLLVLLGLFLFLLKPSTLFLICILLISYKLFFLLKSPPNPSFEGQISQASFSLKIIFLVGAMSLIGFF